MHSNPGRAYRQLAAQGSSLVGIVIQSYDQIVCALYAAGRAIKAQDIEAKTNELNRAISLLGHLQSALDAHRGPEVAQALDRFYNLARSRMVEASAKNSADALARIAADFLSMREAWQQVEASEAVTADVTRALPPVQQSPQEHAREDQFENVLLDCAA